MADSNWGWGDIDSYLSPAPNTNYGTYLPVAQDQTTGAFRPAMPSVLRSVLQGATDLMKGPGGMTIDNAGNQNITPGAALSLLGATNPIGFTARTAPAAVATETAIPRVSIPSASVTTQGQFAGLPATTPAPDLLGNFMADRTASASYTPPAGTGLAGDASRGPMSQPGAPMSVPPGAKFTLDNGQKVTSTGLHWVDDSGQTQVQVHHGNANQTQWVPIDKLAGGAAAVAGVAASQKAQGQPKSGAQVIYDSTTPWYLKSAIGNGDTSYRNPLTLLNPFRDVPDSFYPAQTDLASQDPAYRNRLQTVNNGTVGTAAPLPGTGPTNAPATSGAGANLAGFQSWMSQPPPSVYPYLPAWAQRAVAP